MSHEEDRNKPFATGMTLYQHWSEVCYIPHNDAFGIAMASLSQGKAYDREVMREDHEQRKAAAYKRAEELVHTVTEEDRQNMHLVFEWLHTSLTVLLDHIAQLGAVGDLPTFEAESQQRLLNDYEATTIGQLAIRISQLPGTPFREWRVPGLKARFSKHHQQGMVVDIVPEDPRFGGHIPDWGVPDSGERFPKDR